MAGPNTIPQDMLVFSPSGRHFWYNSTKVMASSQYGNSNTIGHIECPSNTYLIGHLQVYNQDEDYMFITIANAGIGEFTYENIAQGQISDADNAAQSSLHNFPILMVPNSAISLYATVNGAGPFSVNFSFSGIAEYTPGYEPDTYFKHVGGGGL